ncbi:MAG TPA: hypothetical protein VFK85_05260 [Anaeromyxobacteraceae bacterium]|nr:hypothetical protein [Anaeromyxobacteraceae bacterium]
MTNAFQTGFRSTHGFPLVLALVVAAMIGFVVELLPNRESSSPPAPEPDQSPALVVAD